MKRLIEFSYKFHGISGYVHAVSAAQASDRAKNDWIQRQHKIKLENPQFRIIKSRLIGCPEVNLAPSVLDRYRELYRTVKDGEPLTGHEAEDFAQYKALIKEIANRKQTNGHPNTRSKQAA